MDVRAFAPAVFVAEARPRHRFATLEPEGWRKRRPSSEETYSEPPGESGIRTHGAASSSTVFETARFDRSRISPSTTDGARSASPRMAETPTKHTMSRGRRVQGQTGDDQYRKAVRVRRTRRAGGHPGLASAIPLKTRGRLRQKPRGDQAHRAQEDSNLRPLDPQSNALSRLSYGHSIVHVQAAVRQRPPPPERPGPAGRDIHVPERGGFEPPVPFRGTTP